MNVTHHNHPLDYRQLAREAIEDGGFTTSVGGWRPSSGYVVSTRKDAERVVRLASVAGDNQARWNQARLADVIYSYVVEYGHDLRHGFLLGAWRDANRVVLDLVQVFDDRREAMRQANFAKQDAIFDLERGESIDTEPMFLVAGTVYWDREQQLDDFGHIDLDDLEGDDIYLDVDDIYLDVDDLEDES